MDFNLRGLLQDEEFLVAAGLLSAGSQGQSIGQAAFPSMIQAAQVKKAFGQSGFRMLSKKEILDRILDPNKAYQIDTKTNKVLKIGGGDTNITTNVKNFDPSDTPRKIRKQYLAESKLFKDRKSSRDQILANTSKPFEDRTASDDFTLIYQYYKFVDPTSVVREAEFENLQSLGSVGEKIKTIIPKWTKGTTLSKDKVKNLESAMNDSFPSFVQEQTQRENTYKKILEDGGFSTNYFQSFIPEDTNVNNSNSKKNKSSLRGMGKGAKTLTDEELIEAARKLGIL